MGCECVDAKLAVTGEVRASVSVSGEPAASVSVGAAPPGETDYERLENIPSIEGVPLVGDVTFARLGLEAMTTDEIDALF